MSTNERITGRVFMIAAMGLLLVVQTSQAKEPSPVATKDTVQGEYLGTDAEGKQYGAQAVLRSSEYDTHYDVLMFQGGLPGDGWKEGKPKLYLKMQDEYNQKLGLYGVDEFKTAIHYCGQYEKSEGKPAQLKFVHGREFIPKGLELKRVERPNPTFLMEPSQDVVLTYTEVRPQFDIFARKKYLIMDSRIIEKTDNAKLTLGDPIKDPRNPLFAEDKLWEPYISNLYGSLIFDEEEQRYKLWYNGFVVSKLENQTPLDQRARVKWHESERRGGLCYATSQDGIKWEKPELGIVELYGTKKNNVVLMASHGTTVIKDPRDPDPNKRYKATLPQQGRAWFSSDGIHDWKEVRTDVPDRSDTRQSVFWDDDLDRFVMYTRAWSKKSLAGKRYGSYGYRLASRTTSRDFIHWPRATVVLEGPDLDREIHDFTVFKTGGIYVGMVGMFDTLNDRQYVELAWSPDGLKWEWIEVGQRFIANSRTVGAYDWGCIFPCDPMVKKDGTIELYYGSNNGRFFGWRDAFFCRATLRPDGWAGLEQIAAGAHSRHATVMTKPITVVGNKLGINADVHASGGFVEIEVCDPQGNHIGTSEYVTRTAKNGIVKWQDSKGFDLAKYQGMQVRLHFKLQEAKLFSFYFED